MKKIFQVSVFAIFILVSCNINSPIAQLDQKPDNIEIKTIPLENTITASPSEDENIESLDFDLEKTQADNFFETSTKLSPTVTRIPTKTPSPLFSINDHQGLFIVAKINKTLNVYTLDGTFIAPLVTNSFDFFNPTYKKQKIIYTTGNEIVIQDLAAMSDKKITIPPNDGINHPVLLSDDKRIMYAARVININGTTGNVENNISLFIDFLIGDDAPISVFENYQNSISNAEISGDGKWIVFQSDKGRLYGATDLYLLDTACLENRTFCDNYLRRITHGTGESSARSPMWSTDNMNIVYECIIEVPIDSANSELSQKLQGDICIIDMQNFEVTNITQTSAIDESFPQWSPNREWIGFSSNFYNELTRKYVSEISIYNVSSGEINQITNTPDENKDFSFWLLLEDE